MLPLAGPAEPAAIHLAGGMKFSSLLAAFAALALASSTHAAFIDLRHLEPRYVSGLVAPSGYNYSWAIDNWRMALNTTGLRSYLNRTTIDATATATNQTFVNACTQFCERTSGCAMVHLIMFADFPEGNMICAVYDAPSPRSESKYTKGMWGGNGTVRASYTFTRNAGRVAQVATSSSLSLSSSASTSASLSSSSASSASTSAAFSASTSLSTASAAATSSASTTSADSYVPTTSSTQFSAASSGTLSSTSPSSSPSTTTTAATTAATSPTNSNWTWIDVPGTQCGDGSPTGLAVSLLPSSSDLLIRLQEGGSCYDASTCYRQNRVYNMNGFNGTTFLAQNQPQALANWFPFNRQNPTNPWRGANLAFIPYCTGDLHGGDNVVTYEGAGRTTWHKGFQNGRLDLVKLREMLPDVQRVWIAGTSSGAFGTVLQYQNAQDAFAGVRIDLLQDSGETPLPATFRPTWNTHVPDQTRCPLCDDSNFDSYIVGLAKANPAARFASVSATNDTQIPRNQPVTPDQHYLELQRLWKQMDAETINARSLVVPGQGHGMLFNANRAAADSTDMWSWLAQFKNDDPNWSSH
uniref:Uncharacterized protein n=1 Tax=Kalmanozyma brasiliensis (strain GHG001) TaxID=1365824 RepID=V5EVU4_KALBG